eukprot:2341629-Amphidinium_carterae.1
MLRQGSHLVQATLPSGRTCVLEHVRLLKYGSRGVPDVQEHETPKRPNTVVSSILKMQLRAHAKV